LIFFTPITLSLGTTDAVFLEKPQYYDLVIDMTTFSPERASRPSLQLSVKESSGRRPSYRLSTIRFTWSDVQLVCDPTPTTRTPSHDLILKKKTTRVHPQWNELDRILQLDADSNGSARAPPSLWTDAWRMYEDVCLACAGLWTGRTWRNSHAAEENPVEERGSADGAVRVRAYGEGIEGCPMTTVGGPARSPSSRRASDRYFPSPWAATPPTQDIAPKDAYRDDDDDGDEGEQDGDDDDDDDDDEVLVRDRQSRTTLALLQTFHAQTRFWLSRLASLLPPQPAAHDPTSTDVDSETAVEVQLSPRDVLELELSPLCSLDARFVEWLAEEYGYGAMRVSVRRGWRDLFGLVFAVGRASSSSSSP
jgi:hypothetical protein